MAATFLVAGGVALAADQVSKAIVRKTMPIGASHPVVPGVLTIEHVQNPGVAFGMGSGMGKWLMAPVVLATPFVGAALIRGGAPAGITAVGAGLIMAGGLGNIIDRLHQHGSVTDFIGLNHLFTCNVADVVINAGVGLMILAAFQKR